MISTLLPREMNDLILTYLNNAFFGKLELSCVGLWKNVKRELPIFILNPVTYGPSSKKKISEGEMRWVRKLASADGSDFQRVKLHITSESQLFISDSLLRIGRMRGVQYLDFRVKYEVRLYEDSLSDLKEILARKTLKSLRAYDEGRYPAHFFSNLVSKEIISTPVYHKNYEATKRVCSRIAEDIRSSWYDCDDRLDEMIKICQRVGRYDLADMYRKNRWYINEDGRYLCNTEWYYIEGATYADFDTLGLSPEVLHNLTPT